MRAKFLTIGILILDNLTLDFPMPVKYACVRLSRIKISIVRNSARIFLRL
jgi:hypothetical protein